MHGNALLHRITVLHAIILAEEIGEQRLIAFEALSALCVGNQDVNFDDTAVPPLKPFQSQEFHYSVGLGGGGTQGVTIAARLLFRPLPPYFLRALGSGQAPSETQLSPLVGNVQTIVMATDTVTL